MGARSTVLVLFSLFVALDATAAPTAEERCRTRKIAATERYAAEVLRCATRAIRVGSSPPSCLLRAEDHLARAFAKEEAKAACAPALATARSLADAFTSDLLAASPAPTPTPAVTPTPSSTGCGNGFVEAGEQCDGQAYCSGTCSFALPSVCCGPTGFCIEGEFPVLADICFLQGLPYTLGAVCAPSEAGCQPTSGCTGNCVAEAAFASTSICCDTAAGCTDTDVDDTIELWGFVFQGCLQAGGTAGLGTCVASNCVPGG